MTFKRLFGIVFLSVALSFPAALSVQAEEDPRIKPLLQEALRLYGDRQYVRSLDLFKQVQRIDPTNPTAAEYIKSSEQRILEWETQGGDYNSSSKPAATWDSLLNSKSGGSVETFTNAKDIIAARRSLVQRMKNRSMNTDNIVKIEDSKRGFSVTLFHDQLFLPGLQTLRDEALPILENVSSLIRTSGERQVSIQSRAHSDSKDPFLLFPDIPTAGGYDPELPNMQGENSSFVYHDIEATRAFILFTYIAQKSMGDSNRAVQR